MSQLCGAKTVSAYHLAGWCRIIIFAIILILPAAAIRWPIAPEVALFEQRTLSPLPEFKWNAETLKLFTPAMDRYLEDHFGFRRVLALLDLKWQTLLIRVPLVQSVLFGKDGWLIYAGDDAIAKYRGLIPIHEDLIDQLTQTIASQSAYCRKKGIRYVLLIPPDKQTIYPEFMPDWLTSRSSLTPMDRLVDSLHKKTDVPVIDIRKSLIALKRKQPHDDRYPLYWHTDTHWTSLGAFEAYKATINLLSEWFSAISQVADHDYTIQMRQRNGGDLATMVGMQQSVREIWPTIAPLQKEKVVRAAIPESYHMNYSLQQPDDNRLLIMETRKPNLPKAVMFRDSFSNELVPLLSKHFSRIVYRWHFLKEYHFDVSLIEMEKPDVVIYEVVERSLIDNLKLGNPPEIN